MSVIEIKVPDIGDFKEVEVIEVLVKPGDVIKAEQSLVTVESDKASMEIPSSRAGVVRELRVKLGDQVARGSVLLTLEAEESVAAAPVASVPVAAAVPAAAAGASTTAPASAAPRSDVPAIDATASLPHASPSVRKFARELGVDLTRVGGTGPKQRILLEDVQAYVKGAVAVLVKGASAAATPAGGGSGLNLLPWPSLDFSKFGPTTAAPLSRIKRLSGPNLARNWAMIPHVTQFDEADVTELEQFRKDSNTALAKSGIKLTMLAFVVKASIAALKQFPNFNGSLDPRAKPSRL